MKLPWRDKPKPVSGFGYIPGWVEAARENERERIRVHAKDCYGAFDCQSCGCDRRGVYHPAKEPEPCIGHQNATAWLAETNLRLARALEAAAGIKA